MIEKTPKEVPKRSNTENLPLSYRNLIWNHMLLHDRVMLHLHEISRATVETPTMDLTRSQRRKTNKKQKVVLPCKPAASSCFIKSVYSHGIWQGYACMAMHFSHKQEPRAYGTEISKFHHACIPIKLK